MDQLPLCCIQIINLKYFNATSGQVSNNQEHGRFKTIKTKNEGKKKIVLSVTEKCTQ